MYGMYVCMYVMCISYVMLCVFVCVCSGRGVVDKEIDTVTKKVSFPFYDCCICSRSTVSISFPLSLRSPIHSSSRNRNCNKIVCIFVSSFEVVFMCSRICLIRG